MKNNFTKIILFGLSSLLMGTFANAQNGKGLEKIIVEKYYVSNQADADASAGMGTLPVGSVTYRIFVDMKQGYRFQVVYGNSILSVPSHYLKINTTTSFFNNEDRGAIFPTYTKSQAASNTVMLDSWLSVGAGCIGQLGIPLADDNGVATVAHPAGVLSALNTNDGLIPGSPESVTVVGDLSSKISILDATSQMGNSIITSEGSWAALYGAVGYDTTNKVLIGQFTTDGDFSFELNMQIGTPGGLTEQYVARDPVKEETLFPGLIYDSKFDGINENPVKDKNNSLISVFPNPTNGNFSVNIKSESTNPNNQLTIYNLVGKVVLKKNLESASGNFTDKVDLSSYPNGMYFIEVLVDGKKVTSKLIKK
jgi:hypothetical protein